MYFYCDGISGRLAGGGKGFYLMETSLGTPRSLSWSAQGSDAGKKMALLSWLCVWSLMFMFVYEYE